MNVKVKRLDDEYRGLPQSLQDGIRDYIEDRVKPGDFLMAVLSNDLLSAVMRADYINIGGLPALVIWLFTYAPATCYGSVENVNAWLAEPEGEKL